MEAIREELARNAAALSDIRTSQIFAGGSTDHLPGRDAHEALEEAATARAREEGLARDSETAALRAEVAELKAALAAEQERTQTVATCQMRQQEIHETLLTAAHDAAVVAQNEARADAAAAGDQLRAFQQERATAEAQHRVRLETAQAELELLRQQQRTATSRLEAVQTETAVQLRLLRAELSACERPPPPGMAATAAASPPRRAMPSPGQVLRDLGQWAGEAQAASPPPKAAGASAAAACSPGGDPRAPRYLERLQRLEAAADAASSRFEELHREHAALKRRHRKLKQQLQGGGASPGS